MHTKKEGIKVVIKTILFCALVSFFSCDNQLTALDIVNESVKAHGSLSEWKNIHSLSFVKKTVLYTKDGSVEKETAQKQTFRFNTNELSVIINSLQTGVQNELKNGNIFRKFKDSVSKLKGEALETQKRAITSAFYVSSQPFHLIESNASFTIEKDTIINATKAIAIKVRYPEDHQTSDQWTYYFDVVSKKILGCKVYHKPTTSFIENTSFDATTPFVFNATRTSTFIKNGKPDYIRAKYWYTNYKVTFKQ